MRLPVEHQRHCILSLLITPHSAIPHYELPLAFFFLFCFLLLGCQPEFKSAGCFCAKVDKTFYRGRITVYIYMCVYVCMYVCMYVCTELHYKKKSTPPPRCLFLLPRDASRCVCCQQQKHALAFISLPFFVEFNSNNLSTRLMFCYWKSCHTLSSRILKSKLDQRSLSCSVLIFQCRTLA